MILFFSLIYLVLSQVSMRGSGLDDFALTVGGVEMNDVRFLVIDPDDCVI